MLAAACGSGETAPEEAAPPAGQEEAPSPVPGDGEESIVALVQDWYGNADPAICDRLTDTLLEFGWEATGDEGREACRESVGGAEPVEDVEVEPPQIDGDEASVVVHFTLDGERTSDELTFVLVDGAWLADRISVLDDGGGGETEP